MKILSIKFLNLNSLKGEHKIRFDEAPFSDCGLFAITGATGAGKTTILDAITVALYGRVHRHNKDAEEMMSRHTAESYSEVEFEVKDIPYRAKWSVRRASGKVSGKMQGCKMELAEVSTGTFLGGHTATSVQNAVVELCGLDYNQFLRSVILSQGDFTKFLKADDNERSELLEKITDTGIYSEISSFTYERAKEEKQKLDVIRDRLNDVNMMSLEERAAFEARVHELVTDEKKAKQQQTAITAEINWQSNLLTLRERFARFTLELSEQSQLNEQQQPDFGRLKDHQKAVTYRPDLVEIKTIQAQAVQLSTDLKGLEEQLPLLRAYLLKAKQDRDTSILSKEKAQQDLLLNEPVLDRVIKADTIIAELGLQVIKLQKVHAENQESLNKLIKAKDGKTLMLQQTLQKLHALQRWLEQHKTDANLETALVEFRQKVRELNELSGVLEKVRTEQAACLKLEGDDSAFIEDKKAKIEILLKDLIDTENPLKELAERLKKDLEESSLEAIESQAGDLPALISTCEQQYKLSLAVQRLNQEKTDLDHELKAKQSDHGIHAAEFQQLTQELTAAEGQLKDLRAVVEIEQRVKNYESDRLDLQADQPCPLCGSLSHPYTEKNHGHQLNAAVIRRDRQEEMVAAFNITVKNKTSQVDFLTHWISAKAEQLARLMSDVAEAENTFRDNNTRLPKALAIDNPATIEAIIVKKKQQQGQLTLKIGQVRDLKEKQSQSQNAVAVKKQLLADEESKREIAAEHLRSVREQLARNEADVSAAELSRVAVLTGISILLAPYALNMEDQNIRQVESDLIKRSGEYEAGTRELQELRLRETALRAELAAIEGIHAEKQAELYTIENELERESEKFEKLKDDRFELFADKNPVTERQKLSKALLDNLNIQETKQAQLHSKQEEVNANESRARQIRETQQRVEAKLLNLKENLLLQLRQEGIASLEALNVLFLSDEQVLLISERQKAIESRINTLKQQLQSTGTEIAKEEAKDLSTQLPEELQLQLEGLEKGIAEVNREIGRLSQIMEEDDRLKVAYSTIAAQIEVQKGEYERLNKLSALIGSADGKKFSRFAQGLTLARLTGLANGHLLKLTDRYEILKSKEKDLELLIMDKYQADVVRPMTTLSGGESFLVSLALALGLSDLASRKVQINSLFIDEGFGTLDTDTLDTAISALENLQAKGKTIGVISHVTALKDRIGTQIQVSKQQGGHSKIKILSYADQVGGF